MKLEVRHKIICFIFYGLVVLSALTNETTQNVLIAILTLYTLYFLVKGPERVTYCSQNYCVCLKYSFWWPVGIIETSGPAIPRKNLI